jgi:Mu-like prophage major head subunit gpT
MSTPARQGGASLDAHKIEAAYTGFLTGFMGAYKRADPTYPRIAGVFNDDRPLNQWVWLSQVPQMKKWIGNKKLEKLRGETHPIKTEPHEASIQVPKHDILNDRLGLYSERIGELGESDPRAVERLVYSMLTLGIQATTLGRCYDNQALIDDDHTADGNGAGASQSNLVGGALSHATFRTACRRMLEFKGDDGEPVEREPGTLVVGPTNRDVARDILVRGWEVSGSAQLDNIEKGTVNLFISPRITDTKWFLFAKGSKAIVVQRKRGPDFYAVDDQGVARGTTNPHTFLTGTYLYGIESEFGAAYGPWWDVVGGPGS